MTDGVMCANRTHFASNAVNGRTTRRWGCAWPTRSFCTKVMTAATFAYGSGIGGMPAIAMPFVSILIIKADRRWDWAGISARAFTVWRTDRNHHRGLWRAVMTAET